jgi:hypothetical protein
MQITLSNANAARIRAYINEAGGTEAEAVNVMLQSYFREHPDVGNSAEEVMKYHLNEVMQRVADDRTAGKPILKSGQNVRG